MSRGQASANKVILVANVGQDPELQQTKNGIAVTTINVATRELWKDSDGNKQTRTDWHRVVFWRKLAELAAEYLKKGSKVYIEGRLRTRSWQDDNAQKHFITEVVADTFTMLDNKATEDEGLTASDPETREVPEPTIDVEDLGD